MKRHLKPGLMKGGMLKSSKVIQKFTLMIQRNGECLICYFFFSHNFFRRKNKGRMKTVSVALALCLNVGVDPPDLLKPLLCAKREAGVDPSMMNPTKVPEKVAQMLQKNYERLQPRARYKAAIDPTVDYLRKLCTGLRRSAKEERVLFHYNGHGVPRPTDKGEIWVFNKTITQVGFFECFHK